MIDVLEDSQDHLILGLRCLAVLRMTAGMDDSVHVQIQMVELSSVRVRLRVQIQVPRLRQRETALHILRHCSSRTSRARWIHLRWNSGGRWTRSPSQVHGRPEDPRILPDQPSEEGWNTHLDRKIKTWVRCPTLSRFRGMMIRNGTVAVTKWIWDSSPCPEIQIEPGGRRKGTLDRGIHSV